MKKLKKFWNKLKYWQKGGIIGIIIFVLYTSFLLYSMLYLENFVEWIYSILPNPLNEFLELNYIYLAKLI